MHKQTILKMCQVVHMEYIKSDDPDCPGCWFIWDDWSIASMPDWVPVWANGVEPEALYEWMLKQSECDPVINKAMSDGGMRPRRLNDITID